MFSLWFSLIIQFLFWWKGTKVFCSCFFVLECGFVSLALLGCSLVSVFLAFGGQNTFIWLQSECCSFFIAVIPGSIFELLVWFLYCMSHKDYSEPYTPAKSADPNYSCLLGACGSNKIINCCSVYFMNCGGESFCLIFCLVFLQQSKPGNLWFRNREAFQEWNVIQNASVTHVHVCAYILYFSTLPG